MLTMIRSAAQKTATEIVKCNSKLLTPSAENLSILPISVSVLRLSTTTEQRRQKEIRSGEKVNIPHYDSLTVASDYDYFVAGVATNSRPGQKLAAAAAAGDKKWESASEDDDKEEEVEEKNLVS